MPTGKGQAPIKEHAYARNDSRGFRWPCAGGIHRFGFRVACPVGWAAAKIGQGWKKPLGNIGFPRGIGKKL